MKNHTYVWEIMNILNMNILWYWCSLHAVIYYSTHTEKCNLFVKYQKNTDCANIKLKKRNLFVRK